MSAIIAVSTTGARFARYASMPGPLLAVAILAWERHRKIRVRTRLQAAADPAAAAREFGFGYEGINFGASFTVDLDGAAGGPGARLYFQAVQVRVSGAEPEAWLADMVRIAERRCPVRALLADAGVAMEMTWTALPGEGSYSRSQPPAYAPLRSPSPGSGMIR
jgi:hypothetical protein